MIKNNYTEMLILKSSALCKEIKFLYLHKETRD